MLEFRLICGIHRGIQLNIIPARNHTGILFCVALQFIRQGRSIDPIDIELIYIEAVVQNLAGHPQEAFKALSEALKRGYAPQEAKDDPELANLQGLPEFAGLVRE